MTTGGAVLLLATGCGRLGFAPGEPPPAADAAIAIDAAPPSPIHRYRLEHAYSDDAGGPALVGLGGSFDGGGYRFGANQGLGLSNAMPVSRHTTAGARRRTGPSIPSLSRLCSISQSESGIRADLPPH